MAEGEAEMPEVCAQGPRYKLSSAPWGRGPGPRLAGDLHQEKAAGIHGSGWEKPARQTHRKQKNLKCADSWGSDLGADMSTC